MSGNPSWDSEEEATFRPWADDDGWKCVACVQLSKGDDFTCDGGKRYCIVEEAYEGKRLPFEVMRVAWPNKSGRAHFGYVVRDSKTHEVVAVIHQGGAWSWWFKLKDEPEELQAFHNDGWVRENLLVNTMNSVMYWLSR